MIERLPIEQSFLFGSITPCDRENTPSSGREGNDSVVFLDKDKVRGEKSLLNQNLGIGCEGNHKSIGDNQFTRKSHNERELTSMCFFKIVIKEK